MTAAERARDLAPCDCAAEPDEEHNLSCQSRLQPDIVAALLAHEAAVREECAKIARCYAYDGLCLSEHEADNLARAIRSPREPEHEPKPKP